MRVPGWAASDAEVEGRTITNGLLVPRLPHFPCFSLVGSFKFWLLIGQYLFLYLVKAREGGGIWLVIRVKCWLLIGRYLFLYFVKGRVGGGNAEVEEGPLVCGLQEVTANCTNEIVWWWWSGGRGWEANRHKQEVRHLDCSPYLQILVYGFWPLLTPHFAPHFDLSILLQDNETK